MLAAAYADVGDFTIAEDIGQDAFLVGFERLSSLRKPAIFGAWIRGIARNLCLRWRRSEAYRARLEQEAGALRERLGYEAPPNAADNLARDETASLIQRTLHTLSRDEREALLLFYLEGKSTAQAAELAGISAVAMRKRVQRARDRMRDQLTAELEEGLRLSGDRHRLAKRVALALPLGAAYSHMAASASVVPGAFALGYAQLAGLAASSSAMFKTAAAVAGIGILGLGIVLTQSPRHAEDGAVPPQVASTPHSMASSPTAGKPGPFMGTAGDGQDPKGTASDVATTITEAPTADTAGARILAEIAEAYRQKKAQLKQFTLCFDERTVFDETNVIEDNYCIISNGEKFRLETSSRTDAAEAELQQLKTFDGEQLRTLSYGAGRPVHGTIMAPAKGFVTYDDLFYSPVGLAGFLGRSVTWDGSILPSDVEAFARRPQARVDDTASIDGQPAYLIEWQNPNSPLGFSFSLWLSRDKNFSLLQCTYGNRNQAGDWLRKFEIKNADFQELFRPSWKWTL
ncbi:MAG: sigma-70 family RNA polymerase sigma factor [Candidatus Hydrogenedentes bacterium]|nr:sigma-70 family RNA polymerase sigma factor [Candidatus Hydrogenedentota bacterium]